MYSLIFCIIAFFLLWSIYCTRPGSHFCSFDNSNTLLGFIAGSNFLVLILLVSSTMFFIWTINKRFGDDFRSAKVRLWLFVGIFCLSFAVRGSWDTWQKINESRDQKMKHPSSTLKSIEVFVIYFVCEILPIGGVYIHHNKDYIIDPELNDSSQNANNKTIDRATGISDGSKI
jgi:hypothetical protein